MIVPGGAQSPPGPCLIGRHSIALGDINQKGAPDEGAPQGIGRCFVSARYGMAPMRNFLVPQTVQKAWVAGRPFFMVTPCTSRESVFSLHLTQKI